MGDDLSIKAIGSFFVGGREAVLEGLPHFEAVLSKGGKPARLDPNGAFEFGQMYVQYVRQSAPKARYPLVFVHGGGMTGASWEDTPDGRPGMQSHFLHHGFDTYVCDGVERGRASWAQYPNIYAGSPQFRSKQQAWESFRFGPSYAKREIWPGQRFPVHAFDMFMKQAVPRWTCNDELSEAAYVELLNKLGKSIIISHSQGCGLVLKAMLAVPERVAGVILFEPSGAPTFESADLLALRNIPHLFIWGDNIRAGSTWWGEFYDNVSVYRRALEAAGVPVTWIDLPEAGIHGNSHILIMDDNLDELATIARKWMEEQHLVLS